LRVGERGEKISHTTRYKKRILNPAKKGNNRSIEVGQNTREGSCVTLLKREKGGDFFVGKLISYFQIQVLGRSQIDRLPGPARARGAGKRRGQAINRSPQKGWGGQPKDF